MNRLLAIVIAMCWLECEDDGAGIVATHTGQPVTLGMLDWMEAVSEDY